LRLTVEHLRHDVLELGLAEVVEHEVVLQARQDECCIVERLLLVNATHIFMDDLASLDEVVRKVFLFVVLIIFV
jgi:hypothetical protein